MAETNTSSLWFVAAYNGDYDTLKVLLQQGMESMLGRRSLSLTVA